MNLTDALSAFQTAAGITPDKISLLVRTILLVSVFIWGAWCIYGEIYHYRHHDLEEDIFIRKIFRILFIVTLMMSLVFI